MEHKYTQLFSKVSLPEWSERFSYGQSACMLGSCFAENAAKYLKDRKFQIYANPFGILFNPISIEKCVTDCISLHSYSVGDLVEQRGMYYSWNHHGRFCNASADELLKDIRLSQTQGHEALRGASWVILTLGTSVVYAKNSDDQIVANCHRVPTKEFYTRRLTVEECKASLIRTILALKEFNPSARILLTVSPIRHWRDGAHQNQLSKSVLLLACDEVIEIAKTDERFPGVDYFPAYEIMLDELRDYRFFSPDLMHPSEQAVDWIMQYFAEAFLSLSSRAFMKEVEMLNKAFGHRILHPNSPEHAAFVRQLIQKAEDLKQRCNHIDFAQEILTLQSYKNTNEL